MGRVVGSLLFYHRSSTTGESGDGVAGTELGPDPDRGLFVLMVIDPVPGVDGGVKPLFLRNLLARACATLGLTVGLCLPCETLLGLATLGLVLPVLRLDRSPEVAGSKAPGRFPSKAPGRFPGSGGRLSDS